jgi:Pyruvate/2-oxoacid:ferredoxin oxidoreductase gamma subunit
MEREVLLTGIGGQGVQLAAQVLAGAAALEGRNAMLFGLYSGVMRGGNSDSTLVVADEPIQAPPIVPRAWSAIVLHPKFWGTVEAKLTDGAVVLLNSSLFEGELDRERWRVFDVPATDMATELGNVMGASMLITGAFVAVTGLVGLDAAVAAMVEAVPPYRRQHVEANERALRAGFDAVEALAAPAWEPAVVRP